MVMRAYRIQKQIYASSFWRPSPLGRWNSAGTGVIYLCESNATALLEIAVHLRVSLFSISWVYGGAEFDESLIETVEDSFGLPKDWKAVATAEAAFPLSTQMIGEKWVGQGKCPVLSVPSVVLPESRNFLINPNHTLFRDVLFEAPKELPLDPRMKIQ